MSLVEIQIQIRNELNSGAFVKIKDYIKESRNLTSNILFLFRFEKTTMEW